MSKTIYKPTQEAMDKIRIISYGLTIGDPVIYAKNILTLYTMQTHKPDDIKNVYMNIYFYLKSIYDASKKQYTDELRQEYDDKGTVTIDKTDSLFGFQDSLDDTLSRYSLKLSEFTFLIPTAEYLDDSQKFVDKQSTIEEEIDYFVDDINSVIENEIEESLAEFKECDVEDEDE